MKILIAPLITRLKLNESHERIKIISEEAMKRGHDVAISINKSCNYSKIKGTSIYEAPLPKNWKSSRIKQKIGNDSQPKDWIYFTENMHSFSDALYIMGSLGKRYYKKDVESLINSIDSFKPDIVYSDMRPGAISASLARNTKIASTVTYPLCEYKSKDPYAIDIINNFNSKIGIPRFSSICDFFEISDLKFVPSIYELEPLAGGIHYLYGTRKEDKGCNYNETFKKIVIRLRSLDPNFILKEVSKAYKGSDYKILLISSKLEEGDSGNISIRKSVNMKKQLSDAAVFIHNGENKDVYNSILTDTPQIIVKCNVYFLKYNGYSIESNNAGLLIEKDEFNKNKLPKIVEKILSKEKYVNNTKNLSSILAQHSGAVKIIDEMEKLVGK